MSEIRKHESELKILKSKLEIETLKALTYTQINELLNKLTLENKELKDTIKAVKSLNDKDKKGNPIKENRIVKDKLLSAYLVNVDYGQIIVMARNIAEVFDKLEKEGFKGYSLVKNSSIDVL